MNESVNVRAQLSPGVDIISSNSTIPQNLNNSLNTAAFVGEFEKGPVNEPILITNALQFKLIFGRATETNYNDWYQVYNFLQYGNVPKIWICRSTPEYNYSNNNGNEASTPGDWGNLLTVEIYKKEELTNNLKEIFNLYTLDNLNYNYYIIIKRKDVIVETHTLNNESELKSNYLGKINLQSGIFKLSGGYSKEPTSETISESLSLFTKENYEIDILLSSENFNDENIKHAETRKDCVVFFGIPRMFVYFLIVNGLILTTEDGKKIAAKIKKLDFKISKNDFLDIKEYISKLQKSSYAFCVFGFKLQEDGFTGKKRVINVIGDIAGLKASASIENNWDMGIGVEKGTIKNLSRIIMKIDNNYKKELYKAGINTLDNLTLMSQKLFVDETFNIQKLHHRNIYNFLKRRSEKILNKYIFNQNNIQLRSQLAFELKRELENIKYSRGIDAGKVVVKNIDELNISIDIYLRITNLSEIIKLNFINAGTNEFSEVVQVKEV